MTRYLHPDKHITLSRTFAQRRRARKKHVDYRRAQRPVDSKLGVPEGKYEVRAVKRKRRPKTKRSTPDSQLLKALAVQLAAKHMRTR